MLIQAYYDGQMVAEKELPDTLMEAEKIMPGSPASLKEYYYNRRRAMIWRQQMQIYEVLEEKFGLDFGKIKWVVTIGSKLNHFSEAQIDELLKTKQAV